MQKSEFFNRQGFGLKVSDFLKEMTLTKKYQVIATLKTGDNPKDEFIAIMESLDLPIYVFTYNIEMNQFVFANPVVTDTDPIDHSIAARDHA